jgi:CRP-like cAMP-binding protein
MRRIAVRVIQRMTKFATDSATIFIQERWTMIKDQNIDFRIFKDVDAPSSAFRPGDYLISRNDSNAEMFIIKSGNAAIVVDGVTVESLSEGMIVGEMALLDRSPRSAEVVAVTNVTAIPIDERRFIQMVGKAPHFALQVMRVMARRLRGMNERLMPSA